MNPRGPKPKTLEKVNRVDEYKERHGVSLTEACKAIGISTVHYRRVRASSLVSDGAPTIEDILRAKHAAYGLDD